MNKSILIFPGGMPRSLEFLEKCRRESMDVVGASSVTDDPSKAQYSSWAFLPFVVDPGFDEALKRVITEENIGEIFTPNPVVWTHLKNVLDKLAPRVVLVNESPLSTELVPYRAARKFAQSFFEDRPPIFDPKRQGKPHLAVTNIAALFRHAETIPGMCDHEKIRALIEIARYSPVGDIVEIGSWWGKSAFIFLQLARLNKIGNVLCVDPWSDSGLVQGEGIVDMVSAQCSADEAFEVYKLNLLPYVTNNLNYLRMPSVEGASNYRDHRSIKSPEFGSVDFSGRIAILHIDGNHSYESAKADVAAWMGFVEKDGWIIIDDYIWPFGDGPKRVGDELKLLHADKIATSFVMGSALFLQISAKL